MYYEAFEQLKRVLRESMAGNIIINGLSLKFNMSYFGTITECGTAACAAGSAGLDPWFKEQGFVTEVRNGRVCFNKIGYNLFDFNACAKFFQITGEDAKWLFDPYKYRGWDFDTVVTEQMVIDRIDELVTRKKTEEFISTLSGALTAYDKVEYMKEYLIQRINNSSDDEFLQILNALKAMSELAQ